MKTKYLLSTLAISAAFVACNNEELVVNETPKFDGNEVVGANLLGEGLSLNVTTNGEGEETRATSTGWAEGDVAGLGWVVAGDPTSVQSKAKLSDVGNILYANHFYQYDGAAWGAKTNIYEGWHFAYFPYTHNIKPSALSFQLNADEFTAAHAADYKADIINNAPHLSAAAKLDLSNVNPGEGTITQDFSVERIVNVLLPNLNVSDEFTKDDLLKKVAIESITLDNEKIIFYNKVNVVPSKLPAIVLDEETGEYDNAATLNNFRSTLYANGGAVTADYSKSLTTTMADDAFKLDKAQQMFRIFVAPTRSDVAAKNVSFRINVKGGHFDVKKTVAAEGEELTPIQEVNNAAIDKMNALLSTAGYTASDGNTYSFKNIFYSTEEGFEVNGAQRVNMALGIENFTADYFIDEEGEWDACVDLANALGVTEAPVFTVAKDFAVEFGDAGTMNAPAVGVIVKAEADGTAVLKITGETAWNNKIVVSDGMSVEVSTEGELSVEGEELKSVTLVNDGNIIAGADAVVGSATSSQFTNNGCVTIKYGTYVYPTSESKGDIAYVITSTDNVRMINNLITVGKKGSANVNKLIVKDGYKWNLDELFGIVGGEDDPYNDLEGYDGLGYNFEALKNVSVEIENAQVSSVKNTDKAVFAEVTMTGATSSLTGVSVTGALNVTDKGAVDCVELNTVTSDGDVKAEIIKNNVTAANVEVATSITGNVTAAGNVTAKSITGDVLSAVDVNVADGAIVGNVTATGNVTAESISKTLNVNGNGTVTVETIEGAVTLNGKPTVVGAVINNDVTVESGEATFNNVKINGTLTINKGAKANLNSEKIMMITEIVNNGGELVSDNDIKVTNITLQNQSKTTLGEDWENTVWYTDNYVHNNSQLNGYVKKAGAIAYESGKTAYQNGEALQNVFKNAKDGDVIVLAAGDYEFSPYSGTGDILNKSLTIIGEDGVVFKGQNNSKRPYGIRINSHENKVVTIKNVRIEGGIGSDNGALYSSVYVKGNATVNLHDCVLNSNIHTDAVSSNGNGEDWAPNGMRTTVNAYNVTSVDGSPITVEFLAFPCLHSTAPADGRVTYNVFNYEGGIYQFKRNSMDNTNGNNLFVNDIAFK